MTYHYQPRGQWLRCETCGLPAAGASSRFCSVPCQPRGGGVPYATVLAAVRAAVAAQESPEGVTARLGVSAQSLNRRLYRHGDRELARWFGPATRAERYEQAAA